MKKLTIGLFNDSFFPLRDGVVSVVDNYARNLSKYADVVVFVPDYKKKFNDKNLPYKVIRCRSIKIPFLDYSLPIPLFDKKFKKEINNYKLDIVHIHSPFTLGSIGIKYAKKNNIPCVATMHSQFKRDFYKAIKNNFLATKLNNILIKTFEKCDVCWAVNNEVARIYYEDYHYKTLPKVMDNATEMKPVKNKTKANNYINKKHNIKNDELVFLFVGRINTLKNILFIADSIKIVKDKNINFKMLFVGDGQDEDKLRKKIKELKIEDNCILCGKITDRLELANYYSRADLFLFPSLYDCASIVQIEAASQNTPTVFLKGSATSSTVIDNVNGFISEPTVLAYAEKIIEIVNNKKLYEKVSKRAYKDLYRTWDTSINEVLNNYQDLIKQKREK